MKRWDLPKDWQRFSLSDRSVALVLLFFLLLTPPLAIAVGQPSSSFDAGPEDKPDNLPIATTNSPPASPSENQTNAVNLSEIDTNAPGFSNVETGGSLARSARPNSRLDLQSFRIIWERNIFNPNRTAGSTRVRPRRTGPERVARTQSFVLVGTMSYEKGHFAFFQGSSSEYEKVLEPAGEIAGYKITEVNSTHVKLEPTNGTAAIELPVGMQMKKEDEGEWKLSEYGQAAGTSGSGDKSADSSGESSDVLKRLLQKREQEDGAAAANPAELPAAVETEKADKSEKAEDGAASETNEVLKKLPQRREQETK